MDENPIILEENIRNLMSECSLGQLLQIETYLEGQIKKQEAITAKLGDPKGRKNRKEVRINTRIRAKIERITNISPGEYKEFTAYIEDISRHGMKLKITDPNYIHSKIIKVIFWGPKKTVKNAYMQIARTRYCESNSEKWIEIGCHSIKDEQVRRLRQTEKQRIDRIAIGRKNKELKARKIKNADIYLVGFAKNEENDLKSMINSFGYGVNEVDGISDIPADKSSHQKYQIAVLSPNIELSKNPHIIEQFKSQRPNVAGLAIVEDGYSIDDADPQGHLDYMTMEEVYVRLHHYIKKALLHHFVPQTMKKNDKPTILTISSNENLQKELEEHFHEIGYECQFVNDRLEAEMSEVENISAVIFDQGSLEINDLAAITNYYHDLPMVSLTNDWDQGEIAISMGINNYISLPLEKDKLDRILDSYSQPSHSLGNRCVKLICGSKNSFFLG
ncbi:MAG: PilZ domain-containing protein, partial [Phycisphaerae bacterium]|nr:PilZ domain-containing protein [Phycisphaerae bacterium]